MNCNNAECVDANSTAVDILNREIFSYNVKLTNQTNDNMTYWTQLSWTEINDTASTKCALQALIFLFFYFDFWLSIRPTKFQHDSDTIIANRWTQCRCLLPELLPDHHGFACFSKSVWKIYGKVLSPETGNWRILSAKTTDRSWYSMNLSARQDKLLSWHGQWVWIISQQ